VNRPTTTAPCLNYIALLVQIIGFYSNYIGIGILLWFGIGVYQAQAQVVINEIVVAPAGGTTTNSLFTRCGAFDGSAATGALEWVELFNSDPCNPVDIGCFILASNSGEVRGICGRPGDNSSSDNAGSFTFPAGTIIPPNGYITIGVGSIHTFNLSQYLNSNLLCVERRWFLADVGSWLGLYRPNGQIVNAVYWGGRNANDGPQMIQTGDQFREAPITDCTCNRREITLASANTLYMANRIEYVGKLVTGMDDRSTVAQFYRFPNGSPNWKFGGARATPGGCNADSCVSRSNLVRFNPKQITVCAGEKITINPIIDEGYDAKELRYRWTSFPPGINDTSLSLNFEPKQNMTIVLQTRLNGCGDNDTITIQVFQRPRINFDMPRYVCVGTPVTIRYTGEVVPDAVYQWEFGGVKATPGGNVIGPHTVQWDKPNDSILVRLKVNHGSCSSDWLMKYISVLPLPTVSLTVQPKQVCINQPATVTFTGQAHASATFNWEFDGGLAIPGGEGRGPHSVRWNVLGIKRIGVNVTQANCSAMPQYVEVEVSEVAGADFSLQPNIICGQTPAIAQYLGQMPANAVFEWDFDGGTAVPGGNSPGPHRITWPTEGTKSVRLSVRLNDCRSQPFSQQAIIRSGTAPDIVASANRACTGTSITLQSQTTPANNVRFNWQFDGGIASPGGSVLGPHSVRWNTPGQKRVILTFESADCPTSRDTILVTIAQQPQANVDVPSPARLCLNDSLTIRATGIDPRDSRLEWNFDGASSRLGTAAAGPHVLRWNSPGTRNIRLTLTAGGCSTTLGPFPVEVIAVPQLRLEVNPTSICLGESVRAFANAGNGQLAWEWDGGTAVPGGVSTGPHQLTWNTIGQKNVNVSLSNNGCTNIQRAQVMVNPMPQARLVYQPQPVCTGQPVTFRDSSTVAATATYNWQFGGGTPSTATGLGPHRITWTDSTLANVSLTVRTGACSTVAQQRIPVHIGPAVGLLVSETTICTGDSLVARLTVPQQPDTRYTWSTPGAEIISSQLPDSLRLIYRQPGTYNISVQARRGFCTRTAPDVPIQVIPYPIADFRFEPSDTICPGEWITVRFTGQAAPNTVFDWQFVGAEHQNLANNSIRLRWDQPVSTQVSLQIRTGDCVDGPVSRSAIIRPKPTVTLRVRDRELCALQPTKAYVTSNAGAQIRYFWFANGGQLTPLGGDSLTIVWNSPGNKKLQLIGFWNGCISDTATVMVQVKPVPTPVLSIVRKDICLGDTIFANLRSDLDGRQLVRWRIVERSFQDSLLNGWTYAYFPLQTGRMTIQAQVERAGCWSAIQTDTVRIYPLPTAVLSVTHCALCLNQTNNIRAIGQPLPGSRFIWQWEGSQAVGDSTNPQVHVRRWPTEGTFGVSLQVKTERCSSRVVVDSITVYNPQAEMEVPPYACVGQPIPLNFTAPYRPHTRFTWDFDSATVAPGVGFGPHTLSWDSAGTRTIRVQTFAGPCSSDVHSQVVRVLPKPDIRPVATPDSGQAPHTARFTVEHNSPQLYYLWDYGDGGVGTGAPTTYTYNEHGYYVATLFVEDPAGCKDTAQVRVAVVPRKVYMPNAISPNGDGVNDQLTLFNLNSTLDYRLIIFNRWGQIVFESSDKNRFWDGTFNGTPVPEGVFVYHLSYRPVMGFSRVEEKGTVTVVY
jgi:gliding motility-associated-like protein